VSGERVVVAMSGGVDSSVAAARVVAAGFDAVGVTMHLAGSRSRCCSLADADDARRVAERLGIRFFVANYAERFRKEVVETFADAYLQGRTPIPCVTCNTQFKFHYLAERARAFGAQRVATGHYARSDVDPDSGLFRLRRAADEQKDQTYFLFQLTQEHLAHGWFPLGDLTKQQVRAEARELGLETAEEPESQEICFVPDGDYRAVVEEIRPDARQRPGTFVDEAGRYLGRHPGVHHFTIGQRRGLGITSQKKLYVQSIDAEAGRVVLADKDALRVKVGLVDQVSWVSGSVPDGPIRARVRIRYRHAGVAATVEPIAGSRARVVFDDAVTALCPGQAAVFDDGDIVLGGGWIEAGAA
jgi:tRNA-specific 2-thiouridylase